MDIAKGYKNTEFGVFPEDWQLITFGELGTLLKGNGISREESHTGEIPAIRYGELYINQNDYIKRFYSFVSPEIAASAQEIYKGDLLFTASGETKEDIGKSVSFVDDFKAYAGGDLIILRPQKDLNPVFMGYMTNAEYVRKQKASAGQGDAVVHITSSALSKIKVAIPPKYEQEIIANALSDFDAFIEPLNIEIAKKQQIKEGAMQQLMTGKTRLPGFNKHWVEETLESIAELKKGNGLSKEKISGTGKRRCILYGEIFTTYNYLVRDCKSKTDFEEGTCSMQGDVIMPGSTTTKGIDLAKAVCINDNDILLGGDIIIIRNTKKLFDSLFLAIYLSEINRQAIAEISQGTTIIHLHAKQLGKVKVFIPSDVREQSAIAEILSDMDSEIQTLEAERDKYTLIKQGMMQELLTGKTRLI